MTVSADTYIARMLALVGWTQWTAPSERRYPEFRWSDAVADAILHYAKVDTPIRAVMLSRLGPNVWHQDLTQAMATLEELEETAKLVQNSAPNLPENLSDAQIEELRQNFGAAW